MVAILFGCIVSVVLAAGRHDWAFHNPIRLEFGRLPMSQSATGHYRNPSAFTMWLAGAGVKAGTMSDICEPGVNANGNRYLMRGFRTAVLHLSGRSA